VVLQVGDDVLEHLAASSLLHPRELGRRVGGAFAVDDFGEQPLAEHGPLVEDALLPEVGLVGAHLVPRHHGHLRTRASYFRTLDRRTERGTYLVSGGAALDAGTRPHQDERVQKVALDARRREVGVVRLQEHHAHDVVAYVPLSLQLLGKHGKYFCLPCCEISKS